MPQIPESVSRNRTIKETCTSVSATRSAKRKLLRQFRWEALKSNIFLKPWESEPIVGNADQPPENTLKRKSDPRNPKGNLGIKIIHNHDEHLYPR